VTVNAIAPGTFPALLNSKIINSPDGKELLLRAPIGRFGELPKLVTTAVYLASHDKLPNGPDHHGRQRYDGQRRQRIGFPVKIKGAFLIVCSLTATSSPSNWKPTRASADLAMQPLTAANLLSPRI
jgi:NAD(P)-dependent dehydrogenase (short-subunit alcohol dehydrogenase family)